MTRSRPHHRRPSPSFSCCNENSPDSMRAHELLLRYEIALDRQISRSPSPPLAAAGPRRAQRHREKPKPRSRPRSTEPDVPQDANANPQRRGKTTGLIRRPVRRLKTILGRNEPSNPLKPNPRLPRPSRPNQLPPPYIVDLARRRRALDFH